jgi:hypothetical protein
VLYISAGDYNQELQQKQQNEEGIDKVNNFLVDHISNNIGFGCFKDAVMKLAGFLYL